MKLDFKSLAFGYDVTNGSSTPAWETALGQSKNYKIQNKDDITKILCGMIYKQIPPKYVSFKKGKGGHVYVGSEYNSMVLAAVFDKVFINGKRITGGKYLLMILRDDSKSHEGRLKLKYGPDNTYKPTDYDCYTNQMFIDTAKEQLGLDENACWFISSIDVIEQDELHMNAIVINQHSKEIYEDTNALHEAWEKFDKSLSQNIEYVTEINLQLHHNRIFFGAPGTGKSHELSKDLNEALSNGGEYERVTFHPDYSYASFVGTYKPVMVTDSSHSLSDASSESVLTVLLDDGKTAQEKYDILHGKSSNNEHFKASVLSTLLGLYSDGDFKCEESNSSEELSISHEYRNNGICLRPYVNTISSINPENKISYSYVPGPFMRILVKALKNAASNDPKPYILVIEEINRANVAAVFGDVFQLLDRDKNNISEYPITTSQDMRQYLSKELNVDENNITEIKIPNNMYIWATMNSADQGVFPMDTAFKRRWNFKYIGIDDAVKDIITMNKYSLGKDSYQCNATWNDIRKAINDVLSSETYKINEDKLLGPFFISKTILDSNDSKLFCEVFKDKVLMYLYNDVIKQKANLFFEKCTQSGSITYSNICSLFDEQGINIFPDDVVAKIKANTNNVDGGEMKGNKE